MSTNIWNAYADWSEVAITDSTDELKRKITGGPPWSPNHVSHSLEQFFRTTVSARRELGTDSCILDFGCGLGRNASMLRRFFPRVIGIDIPEMINRLKLNETATLYDAVYSDMDVLAQNERVNVLYDSVVFQHVIDIEYVTSLATSLM